MKCLLYIHRSTPHTSYNINKAEFRHSGWKFYSLLSISCSRVIKKGGRNPSKFPFHCHRRVVTISLHVLKSNKLNRNYMCAYFTTFNFHSMASHRCFMICEIHYFPTFQPAKPNIVQDANARRKKKIQTTEAFFRLAQYTTRKKMWLRVKIYAIECV